MDPSTIFPSSRMGVTCFSTAADRKAATELIEREIATVEKLIAGLDRNSGNEQIAHEIATLENLITGLKTRKNALQLVFRLPIEVLDRILIWHMEMVCKEPHTSRVWLRVGLVCTAWRQIVIQCPHLWTRVFCLEPNWNQDSVLRRSRALPMQVSLDLDAPYYQDLTTLDCPEFASVLARAVILGIHAINCEDDWQLEDIDGVLSLLTTMPAPRMDKFCFNNSAMIQFYLPVDIFQNTARRLKEIQLRNCSIPLEWPLLSQLTSLEFSHLVPGFSKAQVALVLQSAPGLEELVLWEACEFEEDDDIDPRAPSPSSPHQCIISLPDLKSFEISATRMETVWLLCNIAHPSMTLLTLSAAESFQWETAVCADDNTHTWDFHILQRELGLLVPVVHHFVIEEVSIGGYAFEFHGTRPRPPPPGRRESNSPAPEPHGAEPESDSTSNPLPGSDFRLNYRRNDTGSVPKTKHFLDMFNLASLRSVRLQIEEGSTTNLVEPVTKDFWVEVFGSATLIDTISIGRSDPALLEALCHGISRKDMKIMVAKTLAWDAQSMESESESESASALRGGLNPLGPDASIALDTNIFEFKGDLSDMRAFTLKLPEDPPGPREPLLFTSLKALHIDSWVKREPRKFSPPDLDATDFEVSIAKVVAELDINAKGIAGLDLTVLAAILHARRARGTVLDELSITRSTLHSSHFQRDYSRILEVVGSLNFELR
ncbi:hypothetical protein H0H92_004057 [Tricholoma furcatifolium]|nr:hypothetical protein H0H92_004057 [Tricholoma furcatifolium]